MQSNLQETYTRINSVSDISNFLSANCTSKPLFHFISEIYEILYILIVPTYQQMILLWGLACSMTDYTIKFYIRD